MTINRLDNDGCLLIALAEQLKLPLVQIARQAEASKNPEELRQIISTAEISIQLIDGLILGINNKAQTFLSLQPVSLSSVLQASREDLVEYARNYNCKIELDINGRFGPVMGDFKALQSAFTALGHSMIESQSQAKKLVVLSAYGNRDSVKAGVFSEGTSLNFDMFKRSKVLAGLARQPLTGKSSSPVAGLFIADSLFTIFASQLKLARHHKLSGLVTTLQPSKQLRLV
ncbi:MAG: hypothetical protein U0451_01340 [Candidatus Saccharimonadales bacterium]